MHLSKVKTKTANPVALISFNTWQAEYNGSSDVLNEKITIDDVSFNNGTFAEPFDVVAYNAALCLCFGANKQQI